jgi:hypothetical protein
MIRVENIVAHKRKQAASVFNSMHRATNTLVRQLAGWIGSSLEMEVGRAKASTVDVGMARSFLHL